MSKIKRVFTLLIIVLITIQCSRKDPFLIEKNRVGLISNIDLIGNIEEIFKNDSIVTYISEGEMGGRDTKYIQENDQYLIFSKRGKHLMTIVPKIQHESTSTVKYVEIMNPQFKTEKGINLNSPFKDINVNYLINKIEPSLSSATLYIDELNATISLDKKELGLNQFSTKEITVEQIPDLAKIKYLTIWFN
jgi:hypothetical protein|tara:strand:+ start:10966 stop:11538 length:573 start_codon:yes stop_codon:yes gene_type:complete